METKNIRVTMSQTPPYHPVAAVIILSFQCVFAASLIIFSSRERHVFSSKNKTLECPFAATAIRDVGSKRWLAYVVHLAGTLLLIIVTSVNTDDR